MMIDFQEIRVGSPALDLNYFMFNCLSAEDMVSNRDTVITTYYMTLMRVLMDSTCGVPFTLDELKKECQAKNIFGFLMALDNILRMQSSNPHTTNDERVKSFVNLNRDENTFIFSQDKDNQRILAMFDTMFTDEILSMTYPQQFLGHICYKPDDN